MRTSEPFDPSKEREPRPAAEPTTNIYINQLETSDEDTLRATLQNFGLQYPSRLCVPVVFPLRFPRLQCLENVISINAGSTETEQNRPRQQLLLCYLVLWV